MLIGYARVSTIGRSLDIQREALEQAGVDRLDVDVVGTEAKANGPRLEQLLWELCAGDTLVVWSLDGLARNLGHLTAMVEDLTRRGIAFRSLKENIDTTTGAGKHTFDAFVAVAECERNIVREQAETRKPNAQVCRRRRGPRPKLDDTKQAQAVRLYQDPSNSIDDICEALYISRATLYRYLAQASTRNPAKKLKAKTGEGLSASRRQ